MIRNERMLLPADGTSRWAGMGDYVLISPDGLHQVSIRYAGEPPHGDSFHEVEIDGVPFPGFAWGCKFAFTTNSRYFAASWMAKRYERHTIVVDVETQRYVVLPIYIHDFSFNWPTLKGVKEDHGARFDFDGSEVWTAF